jgi:hypothetical protein
VSAAGSEKPAEAIARARAFVDAHGSPLDRLRLAAALGLRPPAEARAALEALQREDGSFPPPAERPAAGPLAATLAGIEALLALGLRRGAALERAVTFVAARQAQDGSWSDAPAAPAGERVALTARIGAALARTPFARPSLLAAASRFLERAGAEARLEGGTWQDLAGLAAFYANVPDERSDEVLQLCGRELERGFRSLRNDALATVRVLLLCDAPGGMPGASLTREELAAALRAEQRADGGWLAEGEGAAARSAAAVDAALALVRLGV